jgi:DNA-binding NarL/FixJ family response regulator
MVVAVIDDCAIYRHGLLRALEEAGYRVGSGAEQHDGEPQLTVAVVRSDEDRDRLDANDDVVVVAVVEDASTAEYAEALAAGASAVVPEDAPVTAVVEAVDAAIKGRTVLPVAVAQELARSAKQWLPALADDEVDWLRKLAHGATVAQLAAESFHSERDMYRVLRRLYSRIGVSSRAEAIVAATRLGVLG